MSEIVIKTVIQAPSREFQHQHKHLQPIVDYLTIELNYACHRKSTDTGWPMWDVDPKDGRGSLTLYGPPLDVAALNERFILPEHITLSRRGVFDDNAGRYIAICDPVTNKFHDH